MWKEFKAFISRGNVIDMAVGIIIGSAFTAIVTALVADIITPLIGVVIGGIDFTSLSFNVKEATINYGAFIQSIINFLLVAFVLFMMIKGITKLQAKTKKQAEAAPATTKECPFCFSTIHIDATKCPHCTSTLDSEE